MLHCASTQMVKNLCQGRGGGGNPESGRDVEKGGSRGGSRRVLRKLRIFFDNVKMTQIGINNSVNNLYAVI